MTPVTCPRCGGPLLVTTDGAGLLTVAHVRCQMCGRGTYVATVAPMVERPDEATARAGRRRGQCVGCGDPITWGSRRCRPCEGARRTGFRLPSWPHHRLSPATQAAVRAAYARGLTIVEAAAEAGCSVSAASRYVDVRSKSDAQKLAHQRRVAMA